MTTKTVHKIEVDATQFKAFYDLFNKYRSELDDIPEEWRKVGGEMGDAGKSMGDFVAATGASKDSLALAAAQAHIISNAISDVTKGTHAGTKAQKDFLVSLRASGGVMKTMAKDAKALGSAVFGIGRFMMRLGGTGLKLTGLGALVGGGFGALSLLGLDRMSRSAVSTQGEARGIGVSVGQLQAFRTDFGRYADPGVMNRVAQAQGDMSQWAFLSMATGISPDKVATMSPAEMSIAMMRRARNWWDHTPANMRSMQTLRATGLDRFFSFDEVRRLGAMSGQEFSQASGQFSRDSKTLDLSNRTVDAWYLFERQLRLAGQAINADLTRRMADLGPSLGKLEQAITKDFLYLADKILTPKNIDAMAKGINDFAHYLGSQEFRDDMRKFGQLINDTVHGLEKLVRWLGLSGPGGSQATIPGTGAAINGGTSPGTAKSISSATLTPEQKKRQAEWDNASTAGKAAILARAGLSGAGAFATGMVGAVNKGTQGWFWSHFPGERHFTAPNMADPKIAANERYLSSLDKKYGLPGGTMDGIWWIESSRGKFLKSKAGAIGPFGFMKPTGHDMGLSDADMLDFHKSGDASARYLSGMFHKTGGMNEALAGYNMGPGALNAEMRKYGSGWMNHLPSETADYIRLITRALAERSAVKLDVHVTNDTAARVAISTNAGAVS